MPNHYTTVAICSPGYEFNCEQFNEQHKETNFCEQVSPMPEGASWYEWCTTNWGTKWGTYEPVAFHLGGDSSPVAIKFQSAWGPPKILEEIADWLKSNFQFEDVSFVGFDPYDDTTKLLLASLREREP